MIRYIRKSDRKTFVLFSGDTNSAFVVLKSVRGVEFVTLSRENLLASFG